nr:ribosomal protein S16 [Helleborus niger]WIW41515.1 ribosomal protein S16 [Helleborus niger]
MVKLRLKRCGRKQPIT